MTAMHAFRQRVVGFSLLVLWLASCGTAAPGSVGTTPASHPPTATPPASRQEGSLSIVSPLESTPVSGGQDIRISLRLVDHDGQPVEAAAVQAELWTPAGELLASLPCADRGDGRYLSDYVRLPLRGAGGTWHVVGSATWNEGQQADVEGTLQAAPSVSEMYQSQYGFWLEQPRIFGLGTGFYNLSQSGGLHFEDGLDEDGSGYAIFDNYRYDVAGVSFAVLEIHWRRAEFPADGAAAMALAQSLAQTGLHHQDAGTPLTKLTAAKATFQGGPAWQVLGRGKEYYVSAAAAEYPVQCLIFNCPGSKWLWSLVIATDHEPYVEPLRALQATFECPAPDPD